MSFLEWRRFNFFELKKNVDQGQTSQVLGDSTVAAYTSGNGYIVVCDTSGFIHLISRTWNIISFKGYETTTSHAVQLKQSPLLVTIGEDEPGLNCIVKVWDTDKLDKNDVPMCVRILRSPVERNYGSKPPQPTTLCAQNSLLVVGMSDGTIWLRRGDITRDRGSRQRTMRDGNAPITGLAIRSTAKQTFIFVSTLESVFLYNITVKDKEYRVDLDTIGCEQRCSVLAETSQDSHFMIARDDAVYCYTPDGRGPCYAVDGDKIILDWFRNYLVIVARNKSANQQNPSNGANHLVTVLDIQNKFLVFSSPLQQVRAIVNEWGGFYLIGGNNELYHLDEKDLQSKLSLLFKKNLYDVSIRMAKNQQYDNDSLIDIFRQYGDHLYTKNDHAGAVEQYIKTIGKLEASYVIRKFLDSQHIDKLTLYLQALHKLGYATENHTTLLLNCYTKLDHREKLKEFIMTKDRNLDFDLDIAIRVCRRASADDALLLAKKHEKHDWYLKIQIEDQKKYADALNYIANLKFDLAEEYMKKYGKILVENEPVESTEFLRKLCSDYKPNNSLIISENMLNGNDRDNLEADHANPDDFIHLFLNNTVRLVDFLEYLVNKTSFKFSPLVYNTLIENYVNLWCKGVNKNDIEQKVITLLQSQDAVYDKNQALVICQTHGFSPGVLFLYEDAKLYQQILRYHMHSENGDNMQAALACCRRYGHQEPTLWVQALWYCSNDVTNNPSIKKIIPEILQVIAKERLISPLMVLECLCSSKTLTLGTVREYLHEMLISETQLVDQEKSAIEEYRADIQKLRDQIKQLRDEPTVFQGSRCAACHHQLELPAVHFMCQDSYHLHCFQSYSENDSDCPVCQPKDKELIDMIKSQQTNRDLHETFHNQLERTEDIFSVLSEYFGRGVFNKLTVLTDSTMSSLQTQDTVQDFDITIPNRAVKIDENKLNYGPGAEARLRLFEGNKHVAIAEHQKPNQRSNRSTAGAHLIPASEGRMRMDEQRRYDLQYSSSLEANLTRMATDSKPISKSSSITSNNSQKQAVPSNPFEDDLDDELKIKDKEDETNPFMVGDADDYDKNFNPFFQ